MKPHSNLTQTSYSKAGAVPTILKEVQWENEITAEALFPHCFWCFLYQKCDSKGKKCLKTNIQPPPQKILTKWYHKDRINKKFVQS